MFGCMFEQYGVVPKMEHYAIIVDLLCRQGNLEKALEFISRMPIPAGPHVWAALFSGCKIHHNLRVGLVKLEPDHSGNHMLRSNIYANDGRWDMAASVGRKMCAREVTRTPGLSSLEINGWNHSFPGLVMHLNHPRVVCMFC